MTTGTRDRTGEVEARILDVARDLLAEGGMEALSMRTVADRVGITATAIYHYYDSKQDLVDRVVARGYRRFAEYLQDAARREKPGSIDRLFAIGEAYVKFAFENKEYFRLIFSIQTPKPRTVDELPGHGGYHLLRGAVVEAIAESEVRDLNPDIISLYIWANVHGLVTLTMACRFHSDEAVECESAPPVPDSPLELLKAYRPLMLDGLRFRTTGESSSIRSKTNKPVE